MTNDATEKLSIDSNCGRGYQNGKGCSLLMFFRTVLHYTGLDSPGQLAAVCRFASNYGYRVRAVGTGSSWSRLTSTRDILIDMKNLNRILTAKPTNRNDNLQKEYVDIEVEGGMQVLSFVEKLDKVYGLALPIIGNYAGQTVAGVASTSTHGSGYFAGTMVCETRLFGRWGSGKGSLF